MAQAVRFLFEECLHPFQVCAVNRQLHIARQFAHVVDERVTARRREQTTEWLGGGGPLTRPVLMDLLLDLVTGARVLREDEPNHNIYIDVYHLDRLAKEWAWLVQAATALSVVRALGIHPSPPGDLPPLLDEWSELALPSQRWMDWIKPITPRVEYQWVLCAAMDPTDPIHRLMARRLRAFQNEHAALAPLFARIHAALQRIAQVGWGL